MHKRLLQLLRDNAARDQSPIKIEQSADSATMYLYDVIDPFWGIAAVDFNKELMALKGKPVNLRINSPGGDVFDGRAMATAIAQHGNVTAYIDGLAASAATYVAIAAKQVHMADGAFFMVHNAWTMGFGNKKDFADLIKLLDKIDQSIINDYAKKTGKTTDELATMMEAETWLTAQEALDAGFVDQVFDGSSAENKAWNLSAYEHAPTALTEAKPTAAPTPDPEKDITEYRQQAARRLRLLQID